MSSKAEDVEIITAMMKTKCSVELIGIWVFSFVDGFMFYPHSYMRLYASAQNQTGISLMLVDLLPSLRSSCFYKVAASV